MRACVRACVRVHVSRQTHRVQVGALVLGAVAGVAEGLEAAGVLAHVGLLPRVAAQVDLQVLQPREGLGAALELQETQAGPHRVTPLENHGDGVIRNGPLSLGCHCITQGLLIRLIMGLLLLGIYINIYIYIYIYIHHI